MGKGINLKPAEITAVFDSEELRRAFPPVLDVPRAAQLLQIAKKTLYFWIAQGRLDGAFRKRGKHHLFWRDRLIDRVFNGPEWEKHDGTDQRT